VALDEKALIKKLGAKGGKAFDANYSPENRRWFVSKIIDFLESQAFPDSDIERLAKVFIAAATKAVNTRIKAGFSSGSLPNLWKDYDQLISRTQIIYGIAAMNPELLDAANSDYFDFILERRFRSIQRMAFFVNKNKERKIFGYPSAKCGNIKQVNKDAAASFWTPVGADKLPFILTASGKADPKTAAETLFNKKDDECERNLLPCDPVATILHMDALRAAKNEDKLLQALAAVGDHYLKIDNPLGHFANLFTGQRLVGITSAPMTATGTNVEIALSKVGHIIPFAQKQVTAADLKKDAYIPVDDTWFMIVLGADHHGFQINGVNPVSKKITARSLSKSYDAGAKVYATRAVLPMYQNLPHHFITDSRPTNALFEQLSVKSTELQVGDHVYVINHPLYLMFHPTGAWGGEHSFISEIGSRDTTGSIFRTDLKVEGHGLSKNLLGMVNDMLEWINTILSRFHVMTRIHLKNLKANGRKTTSEVTFIPPASGGAFDFFEYDVPYDFFDHRTKKSQHVSGGFVIRESANDPRNAFEIFNAESSDSTAVPSTPRPNVLYRIAFTGPSFPTGQFKVSNWGVEFYNEQSAKFGSQPLFEKDDKTPKLLTFDDLAKSKPFLVMDDAADAYVTRPRVSLDPTYQTFLKNNGAI
jgi:hypothetical protein